MANSQERLAAWSKSKGELPPACTDCGNPTFTDVKETPAQISGRCSKCGLEHVAGKPASVKSRKPKEKKGADNGEA